MKKILLITTAIITMTTAVSAKCFDGKTYHICPYPIIGSQIMYGSRAGQNVTVVSTQNLDSEHAMIKVKYTHTNAKEFCEDYSQDFTKKCIQEEIKNGDLKGIASDIMEGQITANCKTGRFTNLYGFKLRNIGLNAELAESLPGDSSVGDIILNGKEVLDGSTASGYNADLSQFNALCPSFDGPN